MRQETQKVIKIAKEAGKMAMKYFEQLKDHHISTKEDGSLLTIADTEIDAYIRRELEGAFGEHSVISEESESTRIEKERMWVVDPIDATRNFADGNPYFAISIGLLVNKKPEIGVVFAPAMNELYVGEIGGSAFLNGIGIKVSNVTELKDVKILMDKGVNSKTIEKHAELLPLLEKAGVNVNIDQKTNCAALDLCAVACGKSDVFIHYRAKGWDIVAGIAILESAGGVVCHLDGTEKNIFEPGIVATNKNLKDKIIAITKNI